MLRLFFRIQVIKVAKELVEAVICRQELVEVTQVVLAELTSHITKRLEQFSDGRIFFL